MAGDGAARRVRGAARDRRERMLAWLRRAAGSSGHERHTLLLLAKSALAAWISWAVAHDLMGAQSPAFAPFSAVWMMQVTVYQSVVQALRYVGAVTAGVALQGVFGFLAGPDLLIFGLVTVVALAIGRWPKLGVQGSQVATAAFFAFSTYLAATTPADRLQQLGQLVVLVLLGCGTGVAVNLLVFPPMRYRSAEYSVRSVAHAVCDLLSDIRPALRDDALDDDLTGQWRERSDHLGATVARARSGVRTAQESVYYNPRRILSRYRHHNHFRDYAAVLDALERVTHQVASLVRTLDQRHDGEAGDSHREFMRRYSDLLEPVTETTRLLSEIDETRLPAQLRALRECVSDADARWRELTEGAERGGLPLTASRRPYGVLLVEAGRLLEEFQYTCEVLEQRIPRPGAVTGGPTRATGS